MSTVSGKGLADLITLSACGRRRSCSWSFVLGDLGNIAGIASAAPILQTYGPAWRNRALARRAGIAGAFAGTTTVMLTSLRGQVQIFYVMARDRMLPPFVARINSRT